MVVDTSAVIAVLSLEPEAELFVRLIYEAVEPRMSAANFLEAAIVLDGRIGSEALPDLDAFVDLSGVVIEPVSRAQADIARRAYRMYGRGNHPAALNFGDCFAYALAKLLNAPLLYKGADFAQTDIRSAA